MSGAADTPLLGLPVVIRCRHARCSSMQIHELACLLSMCCASVTSGQLWAAEGDSQGAGQAASASKSAAWHSTSPATLLSLPALPRWLWLAAQQTAWSTANHHCFLPRFKRAARALLLACHRHASGRGAVVSSRTAGTAHKQLGALPPDVVQHILGLAAHPLSAWAPGAKA